MKEKLKKHRNKLYILWCFIEGILTGIFLYNSPINLILTGFCLLILIFLVNLCICIEFNIPKIKNEEGRDKLRASNKKSQKTWR